MLLRRIIAHVRKQEWTAIGIDFVIVVLGVFVATQVADWNTARVERQEYRRALERLDAEAAANIAIIDRNMPDIESGLNTANHALDVLMSCRDSTANREAVNAGLEQIRGTSALPLRDSALRELVTNPILLSQQSAAERQHFSDLHDYLTLYAQELRFYELHPLADRVENNPVLRIGPLQTTAFTYVGVDYTVPRREIFLGAPVDQACRNDPLIKSFFTWTRWQGNIPILARQARQELEATRAFLADR